jgi:hypothetical protein
MNKRNIMIITGAILIGMCAGYGLSLLLNQGSSVYTPSFKITGDVADSYAVKDMKGFDTARIDIGGRKVESIALKDVIVKSKPVSDDSRLLIVGDDGLTAEIGSRNLDGCYIAFSPENAWEAINFNHPISSNIKRISEIVVISNNPPNEYGVNIITPVRNLMKLTPGSMRSMELMKSPRFEGKSSVDRGGTTYTASIYTSHYIVKLKDIAGVKSGVIIMGDSGAYKLDDGEGYLEVMDNSINYICSDMKQTLKKISGIMVDAPVRTVMDTYYDAVNYMEMGEDVMVVYLDGFGYHQYLNAVEKGFAPYLKSLPEADKASTVYMPVTNAGFAAMITGKNPGENGIFSRKQMDLKVPDIFKEAERMGKKAVLLEGNIKILNTNLEPVLEVDANSDGSSDDEIYESAEKCMGQGYNLVFVHFHSIDSSGHSFGDLGESTMKTISTIDGYIRELSANWKGRIIITSDHGMHSVQGEGDHGVFSCEDMIVPYIIIGGSGN